MSITIKTIDGKVHIFATSARISRMWVQGVDCSQTREVVVGTGRISKKGEVVAWRGEDDFYSDACRGARKWLAASKPAEVTYSQTDLL